MKTEFDFRNHQVGDKVYHIIYGWVKIEYKEHNCFFAKGEAFFYNGKLRQNHENPTIYSYNPFEGRMIEVKTFGGFVPRELIKILANNSVVCWNTGKTNTLVFDEWREIEPKKELTTEEKVLILWKKFKENG